MRLCCHCDIATLSEVKNEIAPPMGRYAVTAFATLPECFAMTKTTGRYAVVPSNSFRVLRYDRMGVTASLRSSLKYKDEIAHLHCASAAQVSCVAMT